MNLDIEHSGDVCVLRFSGPLRTGENPDYLSAKLDDIRKLNCRRFLADFRDVPSIGSSGVNFLMGIYVFVTQISEGRLVLLGARPRVRQVLEITRVSSLIPMAPDTDAGLAALE